MTGKRTEEACLGSCCCCWSLAEEEVAVAVLEDRRTGWPTRVATEREDLRQQTTARTIRLRTLRWREELLID